MVPVDPHFQQFYHLARTGLLELPGGAAAPAPAAPRPPPSVLPPVPSAAPAGPSYAAMLRELYPSEAELQADALRAGSSGCPHSCPS